MIADAMLPEIAPEAGRPGATSPHLLNSARRNGAGRANPPWEPAEGRAQRGAAVNAANPAWLMVDGGNNSRAAASAAASPREPAASSPTPREPIPRPQGAPAQREPTAPPFVYSSFYRQRNRGFHGQGQPAPLEPPNKPRELPAPLPVFAGKHASRQPGASPVPKRRPSPPDCEGLIATTTSLPTASSSSESQFAVAMRERESVEAEALKQRSDAPVSARGGSTVAAALAVQPRGQKRGDVKGSPNMAALIPVTHRASPVMPMAAPSSDRQWGLRARPMGGAKGGAKGGGGGAAGTDRQEAAAEADGGESRRGLGGPGVGGGRGSRAPSPNRLGGFGTRANRRAGTDGSNEGPGVGVLGMVVGRDMRINNDPLAAGKPRAPARAGEAEDAPHMPPGWAPKETSADVPGVDSVDLRQAFARAFRQKHASLDSTFKWFDFNNRGALSLAQMQTGLRLLNLPPELRSVKTATLFKAIDASHEGVIRIEAWRDFFEYTEEDEGDGKDCIKAARVLSRVSAMANSVNKLVMLRKSRVADDAAMASLGGDAPRKPKLPSLGAIIEQLGNIDDEGQSMCATPSNAAIHAFTKTQDKEAEAIQLENEISELGLKDVHALAYILTAKCGSLDAAFKWLDFNTQGHFTRVQWGTGVLVLHIDIQKTTGLSPMQIFSRMGGKAGCVTKKAWDRFFDFPADMPLPTGAGNFQTRVKRKLKVIFALSSALKGKAGKGGGDKAAPEGGAEASRASEPAEDGGSHQAHGRLNAGDVLHDAPPIPRLAPEPPHTARSSASRGTSRANSRLPSRGSAKRPSAYDAASQPRGSTGSAASLAAASAAEPAASTGRKVDGLAKKAAEGPGDVALGASLSSTNPLNLQGLSKASPPGRAAAESRPQTTEGASKDRVLQDILGLSPDEGGRFNLKRGDRKEVEAFAQKHGCWTYQKGNLLHVLREGPIAAEIRRVLGELQAGETHRFANLSPDLRDFVRNLAESDGMLVSPPEDEDTGADIEVYSLGRNFQDFSDRMRERLKNLKPGEVVEFPAALGADHRQVVMFLVEELGLRSTDPRAKDVFSVGNLADFEAHVRSALEGLGKGDTYAFECHQCKSAVERHIISTVAQELRLAATEVADGDRVRMDVLHRPDAVPADAGPPAEEDLGEEELKRMTEEAFKLCCTGKLGRNLFLRKTDLSTFLRHAYDESRNDSTVGDFFNDVEVDFDDTLELQVDMGSRVQHGITLEYFNVFMHKVAHKLGWSTVLFLEQLKIWFGQ